jgi:hypothetical protein
MVLVDLSMVMMEVIYQVQQILLMKKLLETHLLDWQVMKITEKVGLQKVMGKVLMDLQTDIVDRM